MLDGDFKAFKKLDTLTRATFRKPRIGAQETGTVAGVLAAAEVESQHGRAHRRGGLSAGLGVLQKVAKPIIGPRKSMQRSWGERDHAGYLGFTT